MKKRLTIQAVRDNLAQVQSFILAQLKDISVPPDIEIKINMSVEEIFVNIAQYAYPPKAGEAVIETDVTDNPPSITITFRDKGIPYDPLSRPDPDITLSVSERPLGGLGVFLVKKMMDEASYEYEDGQNVLTVKKYLNT